MNKKFRGRYLAVSELTEEYGKFISLYDGKGKLNQQDCEFEVGQQSDGTIIAYCVFPDWPKPVPAHGIELCGWTSDGIKVFGKGPLQKRHPNVAGDTETYYIHYGFSTLTVAELDWSEAHSIKFAITNFLFCGNNAQTGGRGRCYNTLKLKLDGLNISFQKVADYYDEIYNSVVGGDKIEVTCELIIEVVGRSREEMCKIADRICDLLTIAKGRKINWINYKVYDINSSIIFTFHQSRRTDPNNGYELINFEQARIATIYLEQCYPAYVQFDTQYPTMLNGVASMIFDSNANRFTLSRALVMFSVVDALSKKVSSNRKFRARIECLKSLYKVCLTNDEITYFVKSRNSVVHELKFLHTKERKDRMKEYEKCYEIFHRLLLRILDYQSHYFDITLQRGDPRFRINKLHPCP